MGAVYFYHLTESSLEATLPMLLGKSLQAGWRVVVRGTHPARLDWLDETLWVSVGDRFIPHGVAGGAFDADQPILLTTASELPDNTQCLMAFDGAEVAADEVNALDRTCILFDGNDPEKLQLARTQWKGLTELGCSAQYWAQSGGGWEKKAESGA
ncbi:MAG: DNA polymerase III subunit chi [Marinosulfonomonas sp.]